MIQKNNPSPVLGGTDDEKYPFLYWACSRRTCSRTGGDGKTWSERGEGVARMSSRGLCTEGVRSGYGGETRLFGGGVEFSA